VKGSAIKTFAVDELFEKIDDETCTTELLKNYPFLTPLSKGEIRSIEGAKDEDKPRGWRDTDKSIKKPFTVESGQMYNLYTMMSCKNRPGSKPRETLGGVTKSFEQMVREKYEKVFTSSVSGHTIIMLETAKYFKDADLKLLLLGCLVWSVPYDHSIHEVLMSGKAAGVFKEYDYTKPTKECVDELINFYESSKGYSWLRPSARRKAIVNEQAGGRRSRKRKTRKGRRRAFSKRPKTRRSKKSN
jgi:hypothetical protein